MIGILGSLLGGRGGRMLGSLVGGRTGGMVGGLAGAFLGGSQLRRLGKLFKGRGDGAEEAGNSVDIDEDQAESLVRAMVNAAKADGEVDNDEAQQILSELGDVSADEEAFLRAELASPFLSAAAVAQGVPGSLKVEAYAVSLVAINVDTIEEAGYLRDLADALGISDDDRDDIHDELGVPHL